MDMGQEQNYVIPQKCPVCGAGRDKLSYTPLGHNNERTIVHIACTQCAVAAMIFVSQQNGGMMTIGVLTDTTPAEAQAFFNAGIVSDDDVINVHNYLDTFDGYTSEIF